MREHTAARAAFLERDAAHLLPTTLVMP
jgi:hypothetical protein